MGIDDIFQKGDTQVQQALNLLNTGAKFFPTTSVPKHLLQQGYVNYKGIIVPKNTVIHKYLLDYYEKVFLIAYIQLFHQLWQEKFALTNEFAFRVLLEMGIENSFLIFDKRVEADDKKLYLVVLLLADYASIETDKKGLFYKWFEQLLNENETFLKQKLTEKEWKKILVLKEAVENANDKSKYRKAIKDARQFVNSIKSNLLDKYRKKEIYIENENIKGLMSGESHTLHGNVFLISQRLKQTATNNHLFRVYSFMLLSCTFVLKRLNEYHQNKKYTQDVEKFLTGYNNFSKELSSAWASRQ